MKVSPSRGLERGASSDLWRNTLSQIPTAFGRLVFLASLRDQNSGRYEHHGLALVFGEQEADRALRQSHAQAFTEWLCFPLEHQKEDLDWYLRSLDARRRVVVSNWSRLAPYRGYMPAAAKRVDRELYFSGMEALLAMLRNECGVADPDRDA
jgi:hypothetical protein